MSEESAVYRHKPCVCVSIFLSWELWSLNTWDSPSKHRSYLDVWLDAFCSCVKGKNTIVYVLVSNTLNSPCSNKPFINFSWDVTSLLDKFKSKWHIECQAWKWLPITSEIRGWRQENYTLEAILGHITRLCIKSHKLGRNLRARMLAWHVQGPVCGPCALQEMHKNINQKQTEKNICILAN